MKYRTFAVLFVCNLVPLFIGMGLFPLLPLYAARFGATHTDVGIFYAVVYVASAASVIATGWLAERVSRRWLFLIGAALGVPTMALLGHATALWQVVLFTAVAWICGGITLTLLSVFTGILVEPASRGRVFSLMFLVYPIDSLIGGSTVGHLTSTYGYTVMFYALAAVWAVQPIVGLFGLRDQRIIRPPLTMRAEQPAAPFGRAFLLLLVSSLLSIACISIGRLGTSLAMQALGFAPEAIASTAIVGGLATIPLTLVIGATADRFGRRAILAISCTIAAAGPVILMVASATWQFQLAATLLLAAWCTGRAVSSALATDLLPESAIARGLPWLGSMDSIASIVGFAVSGFVIDALGPSALFGSAALVGLVGTLVMFALPRAGRSPAPASGAARVADRTEGVHAASAKAG